MVMKAPHLYVDHEHPQIQKLAHHLSKGSFSERSKFVTLFKYVQNRIPFGFPVKWDTVKASETLEYGIGYCNTKSILLVALCRASGLKAQLHAGKIHMDLMRGIIPNIALGFLPSHGCHMWVDVMLDDTWYSVDAHILDRPFFRAAKQMCMNNNRDIGYGVAFVEDTSRAEWDEGFIQSNAVDEDDGAWNDAADYYASKLYIRLKWWQRLMYPILRLSINRNIERIRSLQGQEKESQEIIPAESIALNNAL